MTKSVCGACCQCLCCLASTTFSVIFFLALFLPTSKPSCSISRFYVPALNRSANYTSNRNLSLSFQLRLFNRDTLRGTYYDTVNLTVRYGSISAVRVANHTVPAFYQGRRKSKRVSESIESSGAPWEAAETIGSTVRFRVDLATAVRHKFIFRKTKRKKLVVGADVEVNSDGKSERESIKLNSGRADRPWMGICVVSSILFMLCF